MGMGLEKLIEIFIKLPNEVIEYVILKMLCEKRIDFHNVSKLYIKSLEYDKKDLENQLTEAEACIFDGLKHARSSKRGQANIQRSLYLINQLNKHFPQKLKEKYHYDETVGKSLSWYEDVKNKKYGNYSFYEIQILI